MKKVALIIPYFGKWPVWMDLYLYTCSKQSMIDFLFFTDCGIPKTVYGNTKFKEITYRSYCKRISAILNINFSFEHQPYKLCDCRPFYGIIHKDDLLDYEFWGFGDIDLIYGDLNLMLNDENLLKYDFISAHSERISGHFTVMRNISKYNEAALSIPNWKVKLEAKEFYGLDESSLYGKIINPCHRLIHSAYNHFFKYVFRKNQYRYFDFMQKLTQPFHKKLLFKERYTTPIPQPDMEWIYDLSTGHITVPKDAWYKMSLGGVKYIYTFFSLRKQFIEIQIFIGRMVFIRYLQNLILIREKVE